MGWHHPVSRAGVLVASGEASRVSRRCARRETPAPPCLVPVCSSRDTSLPCLDHSRSCLAWRHFGRVPRRNGARASTWPGSGARRLGGGPRGAGPPGERARGRRRRGRRLQGRRGITRRLCRKCRGFCHFYIGLCRNYIRRPRRATSPSPWHVSVATSRKRSLIDAPTGLAPPAPGGWHGRCEQGSRFSNAAIRPLEHRRRTGEQP